MMSMMSMMRASRLTVALGVVAGIGVARGNAQEPRKTVADLMQIASVKTALAAAKNNEPQAIDDQIRFCEIPAAPFKEGDRGTELRRTFQQLGLQNVRVDSAGNVLGDRPGAAPHPRLVIAAHLDTVFPEGTDVHVRRDGTMLYGPGIGDDCRGLGVLVATIRALKQASVQTPGSITFVADVGEEIDRFVSIDSTGLSIANVGVASRRYRVTFKGPGGHSFGSFGLANPIDAMGRAIAKIAEFQVPGEPRTTFNVGRVGGGTSVNSIPFAAWMEVDLRSSDRAPLASLDANFLKAVDAAVVEENGRWGTPGMISVVKDLVGDRPAGSTPNDAPIVQTAIAVGQTLGLRLGLAEGSTDANLPMSMHIPAITIGGGGRGVDAHALTEAFDTTDSWRGTQNAVLLTIALAQK